MWIEVNKNKIIVGVHSHRCESKHQWIEVTDQAQPGDSYIDDQVVPASYQEPEHEHRRIMASQKIVEHYPTWKQINILRSGSPSEQKKMSVFIDAIRHWSNNPDTDLDWINSFSPK